MPRIRVRARAVDMLGRQQIAGIPTAIHELFKNSHDAYAEHVEVDFYRRDQLLVIRDDGFGMTRQEFEDFWLTLGTESKVGANRPNRHEWRGPRKAPKRAIMGEKGIGRLAIAAIGPQVLVLTRAARPDGLHPLVTSLIHWGLFETPGIDLESIDIPIEEVADGKLPDRKVLNRLVERIRANIEDLGAAISDENRDRFLADLALADFDPERVERSLSGPSLRGDGYGTHFFLRPTNPILADDIDTGAEDSASPLEKMLLGFSNTMMPDRPPPAIAAEFRDHREDGTVSELIGGSSFFTPGEFSSADHHIEGRFDQYGHFQGRVSVYRQAPQEHTIRWPKATGTRTECGPFAIKFAYLQGLVKDSKLPPDEWAVLSAKLNRIGGLYVYRDGIRILPYGNSDYDFLNIERRRTKSASDWFFSYRRIFGVIEITNAENPNLVEKAGREGFRTNRAYREFVGILENFFERLAVDFFRETSQYGESFNAIRADLKRDAELIKRREKSTKVRRKELNSRLNEFFTAIENGIPSSEANRIRGLVTERSAEIQSVRNPERRAKMLIALEADARHEVVRLADRFTIAKPRGVGLSKAQQSDWSAYLLNAEKLRNEVLVPLGRDLDALISEAASKDGAALSRRQRITSSLESKNAAVTGEATRLRREVQEQLSRLSQEVGDTLRYCSSRLSAHVEQVFAELGRTDTSGLEDAESLPLQHGWEESIDVVAKETGETLGALRDQLQSLTEAVAARETLDATTAAIEARAEAYREQLDDYVELAQVGMALGIVQHEFGNTVKRIRTAIRKLKPWADGTPDLRDVYGDLKGGFDHLDAYLHLFTPLSRRLHRTAVDISGEEVRRYLLEVFGSRLERNGIALLSTPLFEQKKLHGYLSTFLPCFVNLVDNAIYWIGTDDRSERYIRLDVDGESILVSNGGPGIEKRVADRIFEFGESSKPGGRGMGLFISRETLAREGYDLTLDEAGSEVHPVFRISPRSAASSENTK